MKLSKRFSSKTNLNSKKSSSNKSNHFESKNLTITSKSRENSFHPQFKKLIISDLTTLSCIPSKVINSQSANLKDVKKNIINLTTSRHNKLNANSLTSSNEIFRKGITKKEIDDIYCKKFSTKNYHLINVEMTKTLDPYRAHKRVNSNEKNKIDYQSKIEKETLENILVLNRDIKVKYLKKISISTESHFSHRFRVNSDIIDEKAMPKGKLFLDNLNENKEFNYQKNKNFMRKLLKNEITKVENNKKAIREKLRRSIISCAFNFKRMNMSIKEFHENKFVFNKPFGIDNSKLVFNYVSNGLINKLIKLLNENIFYVYCFNEINQTPLHIASKKDNSEIIKILINYGSNINAVDIVGRTPLHIAALHNNLSATKTLLLEFSNPLILTNSKKKAKQYAIEKTETYDLLNFAEKLHLIYRDYSSSQKVFQRIKNGLNFVIDNHLFQINRDSKINLFYF